MKIHNCRIFYSDGSLQIFISFYLTAKTVYIINKHLTKYSKKLLLTRVSRASSKKKKNRYKKRKKHFPKLPSKKIRIRIKKIQKIKNKKGSSFGKFNTYLMVNLKGFQEILLESLVTYTQNKINVSVVLQDLNCCKQLSRAQIEDFKVIFKQLKKFIRKSFFKDALNLLFISISKRKSAKILADFISYQFKLNQLRTDQMTISQKDNFFLGFLKQTIILLVKSQIACLTGIKITIKGRFNKAPRARTVKIHYGKFSLQSFTSKIDYFQSTAYTANGTFGVKVWLCENNH